MSKTRTRSMLFAAALCFAAAAQAQVKVEGAWVRATVPQQKVSGGYMQLTAAKDMRLVGASSPAAAVVEIHEMKLEGEVMRMRPVQSIALPAGKTLELAPGGYHFMLMDLKHALAAGQKVPLELLFDIGGKPHSLKVEAEVRGAGAGHAHHGH